MKDLEKIGHALGIEIVCDRKHGIITFNQHSYAATVLKSFYMSDYKEVNTPIEVNSYLQKKETGERTMSVPNSEQTGSFINLMLGTRPDLAYTIGKLSQISEERTKEHW